ncbi:hypothetical protein BDAP_000195 [Binucleata daphniae]
MASSSDWEEAAFSSEFIEEVPQKIDIKKELLSQIKSAIKLYLDTKFTNFIDTALLDEKIHHNIMHHILNKLEHNKDTNVTNITTFKLAVFYGVPCRLLCNVTPKKFCFFAVENTYEKIVIRKKANIVFAIDCQFQIQDLGMFWCNGNTKLLNDLKCETDAIKSNYYDEIESKLQNKELSYNKTLPSNDYFNENDEKTLKKLPTSINMFKKHPYYVVESILKANQAIHPKRPIHGYYKGEAVYSKANVQNLKTEKQLYRIGKVVIDKPYKIIERNEEKVRLYAKWQTKDIQKIGLDNTKTMDYFHKNHIPIDCVYIDDTHAIHIAKKLKIEYKQTCIGMRREPIIKGIFIYTKDESLFVKTLNDYTTKLKTKEEIQKKEEALFLWCKLIKKVSRYKKIKERLE